MNDGLEKLRFYQMSMELWDNCWNDTDLLLKDIRRIEIAKQLTRSVGSVSANIEEGYGRGYGKEYPHFLRISRGSARESLGWYRRSSKLLSKQVIESRIDTLSSIIAMINATIITLNKKSKLIAAK